MFRSPRLISKKGKPNGAGLTSVFDGIPMFEKILAAKSTIENHQSIH